MSGKGNKNKEDIEVVASGQALSVVAGWLGLRADDALDGEEDGVSGRQGDFARRPPLLGLGATHVPSKAKDAATSIGNKLKRRLERGRERGLGDGDGDDDDNGAGGNGGLPNKCAAGAGMKWASVGSQSAGGAAGTSGRPVAAAAAAAAVRGGGGNADDSDSDSEDGGRAAALCRSSRQSQPQVETARQPGHQRHQQGPGASWAAAGPAPRRQGFTRNDLLALSSAYQQEADAQPGYQREGQGKKKKKKNKGAKGGNATVP